MTRQPFLRLALVAAAAALGAALVALAVFVNVLVAVGAVVGAALLAPALTVELERDAGPDEHAEDVSAADTVSVGGAKVRQPEQGTRGFHRVQ